MPVVLLVIAVLTQVLLQSLVDTFCMSICLWTECGALSQMHVEPLHQLCPKPTGEYRVSVRNNIARQTMQFPHIGQEESRTSLSCHLLIWDRCKDVRVSVASRQCQGTSNQGL